jgi:hypothetical protein
MKIRSFLIALTVLFALNTSNVFASSNTIFGGSNDNKAIKERVAKMTHEQKQIRAIEIKERIKEIKEMDKSQLTSDQKKALRTELKEMKKEARAMGPTYIYISGAGVIIIILLILLIA